MKSASCSAADKALSPSTVVQSCRGIHTITSGSQIGLGQRLRNSLNLVPLRSLIFRSASGFIGAFPPLMSCSMALSLSISVVKRCSFEFGYRIIGFFSHSSCLGAGVQPAIGHGCRRGPDRPSLCLREEHVSDPCKAVVGYRVSASPVGLTWVSLSASPVPRAGDGLYAAGAPNIVFSIVLYKVTGHVDTTGTPHPTPAMRSAPCHPNHNLMSAQNTHPKTSAFKSVQCVKIVFRLEFHAALL